MQRPRERHASAGVASAGADRSSRRLSHLPCVGHKAHTEGRPGHDTRSVHWGARQGLQAAQPRL
eukprot:7835720-Alexandrium_andersonii.AAC.1